MKSRPNAIKFFLAICALSFSPGHPAMAGVEVCGEISAVEPSAAAYEEHDSYVSSLMDYASCGAKLDSSRISRAGTFLNSSWDRVTRQSVEFYLAEAARLSDLSEDRDTLGAYLAGERWAEKLLMVKPNPWPQIGGLYSNAIFELASLSPTGKKSAIQSAN